MKTFIELVPRSPESLIEDMNQIAALDIACDGFNLPELRPKSSKFMTPEQLMIMRGEGKIDHRKLLALHLRTQERSIKDNIERVRQAAIYGVNIALLVTGDTHSSKETESKVCAHNVLSHIQKIDGISLATGADLYNENWGRWNNKLPAMEDNIVESVFTQPIFHADTLRQLQEGTQNLYAQKKVFAGIAWVASRKSRDYWHEQNNVPLNYLPQGESDEAIRTNSISQAADMLRISRKEGFSTYVMLMKGTVKDLAKIFSLAENIREI